MIRKFSPFSNRSNSNQGFTLVELLVAMLVFGLLAVLLAQVVVLTGRATSATSKHLDAAGQARLVFDRLASDLAARPTRSDLGISFTIVNGGSPTVGANDTLQFYSQVNGYSGARQVTAVGYRIQQTTAGRIYQLERGAVGTDWGAPWVAANPLVQFVPNVFAAPSVPADSNYDVLASEVFRLEFCYLLNTGAITTSTQSSVIGTNYSNVKALVVAVGVLDKQSRQLVSNTQLQQLSQNLPDCIDGQDPISGWYTAMSKPGFAAGIPFLAVQNIRLFQRTFYVQ